MTALAPFTGLAVEHDPAGEGRGLAVGTQPLVVFVDHLLVLFGRGDHLADAASIDVGVVGGHCGARRGGGAGESKFSQPY